MRIYLDLCCLKRPFDDQSHPRVRLESDAVLALLATEFNEASNVELVRSQAMTTENRRNPVKDRAARVQNWIDARPQPHLEGSQLRGPLKQFIDWGFKPFDALHLATASFLKVDAFVTCDDRLISRGQRYESESGLRVISVLTAAKEFA